MCSFHLKYSGAQIKDERGRACGTYGEMRNIYRASGGENLKERGYLEDPGIVDYNWVRALTVLMHLGLTDRPFVPHNLIQTQDSSVPLP